MTPTSWIIGWDRGTATVLQMGAMVAPADIVLDDGRTIQPFAIAPWADDQGTEFDALPELLKRLRGEWPCVPYGMPDPPDDLPGAWRSSGRATREDPTFHGFSSNAPWQLGARTDSSLDLFLDYPAAHPIRRARRRISGVPGRGRLAFELGVEPRADTLLPIGLHPVFRLPQGGRHASVTFEGDARVHTYPIDAETGVSRISPGLSSQPLDRVPCKDGSFVDLARHPLPFATEELVLVTGHGGSATLTNHAEGYAVQLRWDESAFPSCMMWISNKGRAAYPWNSRFQALAIEPVCAPFDLGTDVARNPDNPLMQAGIPTARSFTADRPWTTRYTIEISATHA